MTEFNSVDNVEAETKSRLAPAHRLLLFASGLVILTFLFFPSVSVFEKAHLVGYGICHQLPERTFFINGQPLPLCARCTGIYLGALAGLAGLLILKRQRATQLPAPTALLPLILFTLIMGVDGVNSYLTFFPNAPHLYEPQNWLRLTTGTFHGLTMIAILYPVVSESLWEYGYGNPEPVIKNLKELALLILGAVIVILVVMSRYSWMLYILTFVSTLGVLFMLSLINTVFALFLTRRIGMARTWGDVALPWVMGLAGGVLMLAGMVWLRVTLVNLVGLSI